MSAMQQRRLQSREKQHESSDSLATVSFERQDDLAEHERSNRFRANADFIEEPRQVRRKFTLTCNRHFMAQHLACSSA
jgi:hypothetical protein